jgi:hypothetical protein
MDMWTKRHLEIMRLSDEGEHVKDMTNEPNYTEKEKDMETSNQMSDNDGSTYNVSEQSVYENAQTVDIQEKAGYHNIGQVRDKNETDVDQICETEDMEFNNRMSGEGSKVWHEKTDQCGIINAPDNLTRAREALVQSRQMVAMSDNSYMDDPPESTISTDAINTVYYHHPESLTAQSCYSTEGHVSPTASVLYRLKRQVKYVSSRTQKIVHDSVGATIEVDLEDSYITTGFNIDPLNIIAYKTIMRRIYNESCLQRRLAGKERMFDIINMANFFGNEMVGKLPTVNIEGMYVPQASWVTIAFIICYVKSLPANIPLLVYVFSVGKDRQRCITLIDEIRNIHIVGPVGGVYISAAPMNEVVGDADIHIYMDEKKIARQVKHLQHACGFCRSELKRRMQYLRSLDSITKSGEEGKYPEIADEIICEEKVMAISLHRQQLSKIYATGESMFSTVKAFVTDTETVDVPGHGATQVTKVNKPALVVLLVLVGVTGSAAWFVLPSLWRFFKWTLTKIGVLRAEKQGLLGHLSTSTARTSALVWSMVSYVSAVTLYVLRVTFAL